MRLIDREYTAHPFLGSRRLTKWLIEQGEEVNRKRVQRLMRLMGLEAIYPKPKLSVAGRGHRIYPYLLRNVSIERADQVWSTDITYVPLAQWVHVPGSDHRLVQPLRPGVASVEHAGRFLLPGHAGGGVEPGPAGGVQHRPGVQFTAAAWTGRLESAGVAVSMDGKGRCLDNVFVERLWRSVKYEEVYLHRYEVVPQLASGLERYFAYYNEGRPHQSLDYRTPAAVYREGRRSAG